MARKQNILASFTPTQREIFEIKQWLLEENKNTRKGFYCNWNTINQGFLEGRVATISLDAKNVGFVLWSEWECTARIEIMEVHPQHRKKGIGKRLVTDLTAFLLQQGICVVDLQCNPASSEPIWRKLGFIDFPSTEEGIDDEERLNKELYKVLIPHAGVTDLYNDVDDVIQLWDKEPYETKSVPPSWVWKITFRDDNKELTLPIIHPCKSDWKIQRKCKSAIVTDKVKRFAKEEIQFGRYLIINKPPDF